MQTRATKYSQLFSSNLSDDELLATFSTDVSSRLIEYLTKVSLPYLTSHQQISLVSIIEGLGQVEEQRYSLDENGIRYLLAFRLFILHRDTMNYMPYRDHNWAFHSKSQEILVDLVTRTYSAKMTWTQARECGIFMWLNSLDSAKQHFETMARTIYAISDPKNPVNCTLFYIALKKKQVLLSLWRMAHSQKEQQIMIKFLSNDFSQPRWKTAALKNAYVLLSKQRYEYSAAFFLLGGSLKDAVNVCVRNIHDIQLAVAIARVYEGDDGPVLKELIKKEVLPFAYKTGDRWLASWAYWKLQEKDMALKCILHTFHKQLTSEDEDEALENRMFLVEDPVLVVLYQQLRDSVMRSMSDKDSKEIAENLEPDFVLHIAKLYDRMGCDILALDLVKNWKFWKREEVEKVVEDKKATLNDTTAAFFEAESSLLSNWM